MQQLLQLAIFTQQLERAAVVEQLTAEKAWKLHIVTDEPKVATVLQDRSVALILIDLDWPDAVALFRTCARELPQVPLVALTPPSHLVALQEIHLAGASGYVAYPINKHHFFTTIDHALQKSATQVTNADDGRMLAVVSLKGGVGRSTLAANLAIALHQHSSTELILAEVHHGLGQLSLMLNTRPRHTLATLASEETIDLDLLRGYLQPHQSGIRLLAAPAEPTDVVELSAETWQHTLALLKGLAPLVVVDTSSAADMVLAQVLTHADDILLVVEPTVTSLCNTRGLLETIHAEERSPAQIHIVLNRADLSGGLSLATIEEYLEQKVDATMPFEPALATFACNRGIPLILSHPRTRFSRSMQQLAGQLLLGKAAVSSVQAGSRFPLLSRLVRHVAKRPAPAVASASMATESGVRR